MRNDQSIDEGQETGGGDQGLSDLQSSDVYAICAGDFHAEEKPPVARSAESDWFAAMYRPLKELRKLSKRFYDCPIILPGDVFNKWNASPMLINWMIKCLPGRTFAVAGNHDLPLHNYTDIEKSAYWTLVEAGKLSHLTPKPRTFSSGLSLYGFSLGVNYRTAKPMHLGKTNVAVIHEYCWRDGHTFPGSPPKQHANEHWKQLQAQGFDYAVFGDNHKGFSFNGIANPGTVRCRTTDERGYKPVVYLLTKKNGLVPYLLDVSEDKWADGDIEDEPDSKDMVEFLRLLGELGDTAINFEATIHHLMRKQKTPKSVEQLILSYLEGK